MRRKLLALVCVLMLLAGMAAPSAEAAGNVYFTAANDTMLELSDATMPFWANGYLYVASTVFSVQTLSVGSFYNAAKQLAGVYSRETANCALYFDLAKNTVDDSDGFGYYPPAILRNGTVFLPVSLVCSYFNMSYTNTKVEKGYLVRVYDKNAVLSNRLFNDAATFNMAYVYEQYMAAKTAPSQSGQTAQQPENSTGSGGSAGQTATGSQTLHLCFRADERENVESLLDILDRKNAAGTFYLTMEEIAASSDLVRRIAVSGHGLGLAADAALETPVAEQLRLANEALWQAAGVKTRLCVLENAGQEERTQAEAAGYRVLSAQVDASAFGLKRTPAAKTLFSKITARRSSVTVWLGSQVSESGLRALLDLTAEAGDRLSCLRETS